VITKNKIKNVRTKRRNSKLEIVEKNSGKKNDIKLGVYSGNVKGSLSRKYLYGN